MIALAVLCAALVFFNLPDGAPGVAAQPTAAPVDAPDVLQGHEVGELLPDFALAQTDDASFVLSEHRGQIVVINLWATWCTPCVNELPCFDRLQNEHPEDVTVLAIHSNLITDDVAKYLSGFDYGIAFAVDETGDVISSVGGSTMLPQTVVLNPWGEVTYNKVGSVTFEMLEELTEAAQTR